MSEHTKGPWLIAGDTTVYALQSAGFRKGEEQFENRFSASVQGIRVPFDELKANARLIAAAPDLLGALRRVKAAFEEPKADIEAERNAVNAAYKHACWAIAKAEGRSADSGREK